MFYCTIGVLEPISLAYVFSCSHFLNISHQWACSASSALEHKTFKTTPDQSRFLWTLSLFLSVFTPLSFVKDWRRAPSQWGMFKRCVRRWIFVLVFCIFIESSLLISLPCNLCSVYASFPSVCTHEWSRLNTRVNHILHTAPLHTHTHTHIHIHIHIHTYINICGHTCTVYSKVNADSVCNCVLSGEMIAFLDWFP